MRKLYNKKGIFTKEELLLYTNSIYNFFLNLIPEKDNLQSFTKEVEINNKKQQTGILFIVQYKRKNLLSLVFPYNKRYIINVNKKYVLVTIFKQIYKQLINFDTTVKEEEFILDHIDLLIDSQKNKLIHLKKHKQYFHGEALIRLESIILLYTLH